jgi:hypothetical protein
MEVHGLPHMGLIDNLARLVDVHGSSDVARELKRLTAKKRGRPSMEASDCEILIRAGYIFANTEDISVTASLKQACHELGRKWRERLVDGESQKPDARRLLKRINDWVGEPDRDDDDYFDAMTVLRDGISVSTRKSAFVW